MGGSQSTRKISVENDNAIQVSQDAIDRIQQQLNSQKPDPPPAAAHEPSYPHYYEARDTRSEQQRAAEEAYWARRIENLKRAHEKIKTSMENEYRKSLKEANEIFQRVQSDPSSKLTPPCQDEKSKVLQCYEKNPDKSLVCSMLVNQFNDCVCKSRMAAVATS